MYKIILCLFLIAFAVNNAQEYAGSETCKSCHSTQHTTWKASGHPYKIQKLVGGNGPVYPVLTSQKTIGNVVNYTLKSGIPSAPEGLAWSDVGFVLGGYHSNARFLDKQGYLIYGNNRQYNLSTSKWVAYTSGTLTKGSYNAIQPGQARQKQQIFKHIQELKEAGQKQELDAKDAMDLQKPMLQISLMQPKDQQPI